MSLYLTDHQKQIARKVKCGDVLLISPKWNEGELKYKGAYVPTIMPTECVVNAVITDIAYQSEIAFEVSDVKGNKIVLDAAWFEFNDRK